MLAVFETVDWAIVIVYVLVAASPGFLVRKYIRSQADFLVAGRTLSVYLATATLTATEMGLVTVMYMAQQGFLHGFSAFTLGLIGCAAFMFTGVTGFLVWGFRASGVTTFAEYYERRYGRGVRLLGGSILAAAGILNYGVFIRVEADFVRILTGMQDLTLSSADGWTMQVPALQLVMTILVALVLGYTLLGGMVSVVITDYIQFIVLTAGMALTTYLVLSDGNIGGFAGIASAVAEHRPVYGMNPFKSVNAGGMLLGMGGIFLAWQLMHFTATSCWQTTAFRTAAVDSPTTARWMYMMTAVNYAGRMIIPMFWGVAGMTFFALSGGLGEVKSIEAMPRYLSVLLPTGAVGFLVAGMLAALMSTHSGYLLAWSGVLVEDLIAPVLAYCGVNLKDRTRLWITRFFILCLGAYLVIFGLWYEVKSDVWSFLAVTGTMYFAGAATLLGFGLYWKRANIGGAFAGLLAGAAPGLFQLVLHISSLIVEPGFSEPGHMAQHWIPQLGKSLDTWCLSMGMKFEALVGLVSYPMGILGMIVGSLLYARIRGAGPPGVVREGDRGFGETRTAFESPEQEGLR